MSGVVWLASYPKSGNTWLRAFLANYFSDPARPVAINALPAYCFGDNVLLHYAQVTGRDPATITEAEALRLRRKVHRWFARARGETVFVKTHSLVGEIDGIHLITPEVTAGAIYVVRDPRDVAVSWSHHYQSELGRAVAALCRHDHYLPRSRTMLPQYIGSWARHVRSWTETPGLAPHVVRYEDLCRRPHDTFADLVRFLRLPDEPDRLDRAIRFCSFEVLAGQERREGFVEARPDGKSRFFRAGRTGEGRERLGAGLERDLAAGLGAVMEVFGYGDSDGHGAILPPAHATATGAPPVRPGRGGRGSDPAGRHPGQRRWPA